MAEAILKFGACERNSALCDRPRALGNSAVACSCSLALPDRIPDYDKKCNIIAVQNSRSDRFFLRLK
ncbi:hypothetical protein [Microcoleus sp.]|uniref:hypothetical protein n=1 Tax=Microcoleus sp. TaxID=44472 RepID=UPI0035935F2A